MLVCIVIVAGMLINCSGSGSGTLFHSNESLRIYELVAGNGSFTAFAGDRTGTRFDLSLSNVPDGLLYFTDRPGREAGFDKVGNIIKNVWPRVYGKVAPNALLRATAADGSVVALFCMLEQPFYDASAGKLRFVMTYLNGYRKPAANLAVTDVKLVILNNAASALPEDWAQLMTGDVGTFTPVNGKDGTCTLSIQHAHDNVFSYTNAPARKSQILRVGDFMRSWQTRFGSTPPNVSLVYSVGNGAYNGVQFVTLTNPLYDEATGNISFTAKILYGTAPIVLSGLRVTNPSLIIDGSYSEEDLQKLLDTRRCENCNLQEADLQGKDLNGVNIKGANLSNANLTGTNLKGADMTGANLTGATIDKANLVGATLLNVIGPTSMQGRVINLVNNCGIDIWAAASGNTVAIQCRSSADCNTGECPPLTDACRNDPSCHNLCTTYPCGNNGDCPGTNAYCGGVPSFLNATGCTSDSQCGANQFCYAETGQCGWKNCIYVPIPLGNEQIVSPPVSCSSNRDCSNTGTQFCYTTTSTTGTCATLPTATQGNSWQLKPTETTPLFVPTPWAGRFWPRTGCTVKGSTCDPRYAGTLSQCLEDMVANQDKVTLGNPANYPVKCRTSANCGPDTANKAIVGGVCIRSENDQAKIPNFTQARPAKSECSQDADCDHYGSNWVCWNWNQGISSTWFGQCGYYQCTTYECSGRGQASCLPQSFSCDTGNCNDEQFPSQTTQNCRQSGQNSPTLAELNMFLPSKGIDFYDISLVDGANTPVQIAPVSSTYATGTADEQDASTACTSNHDCWMAKDYNWVCDTGAGYCVNKNYCGSPGCVSDCSTYGRGLTDASTWSGNLVLSKAMCPQELQLHNADGAYVGCLSPLKACASDHKNDTDPSRANLGCDTTVAHGGTYTDMYQCTGSIYANSCYTAGVGTNCCGCPDWMPTEFCSSSNSNSLWVSKALPYYEKFHAASPDSYTYPFDDKSGTFTCRGKSDVVNVNYNITFCPK